MRCPTEPWAWGRGFRFLTIQREWIQVMPRPPEQAVLSQTMELERHALETEELWG